MKQTRNYATPTLRPESGRDNRLRSFASTAHLASQTGIRRNVIWFRIRARRAAYSQLFEPSGELMLPDTRPIDYVLAERQCLSSPRRAQCQAETSIVSDGKSMVFGR